MRVKNQKSALERARLNDRHSIFSIKEDINCIISSYEQRKEDLEKAFKSYQKVFPQIHHIQAIPGIGVINSTKIVSKVVDPFRFQARVIF